VTRRRRRHHPAAVIMLGTGFLLAADVAVWMLWLAWQLLPWLLAAAIMAAYKLGHRRGRASVPPVTGRPLARTVRTRTVIGAECAGAQPGAYSHQLCRTRGCSCPCHQDRRLPRPRTLATASTSQEPPW